MSVYSWGTSTAGALGAGAQSERLIPRVIEAGIQGKRIVQIACGEQHSAALDDLGHVYCWGRQREGQTGQGVATTAPLSSPEPVKGLSHEYVVHVACGVHHTLAVTEGGRLYQWGISHVKLSNSLPAYYGVANGPQSDRAREMIDRSHYQYFANVELEDDATISAAEAETVGAFRRVLLKTPTRIEMPEDDGHVVHAAGGYCFTVCVTTKGNVYAYGFGDKGQLGQNNRFMSAVPLRVNVSDGGTPPHFVQVAAGQQHVIALAEDGRVFGWGGGVFGATGLGRETDQLAPERVPGLDDSPIQLVACGSYHTVFVARDGTLFTCGHSEYGQQGVGDEGSSGAAHEHNFLIPRRCAQMPVPARAAACGSLHTVAVGEDGVVYSFGWGGSGALGLGDKKYRVRPTAVAQLEGMDIATVAAGWKHTLALAPGETTTFALDFSRICHPVTRDVHAPDMAFVSEGKPILAHRAVVCARSPMFRSRVAFTERFCSRGVQRHAAALSSVGRGIVPSSLIAVDIPLRFGVAAAFVQYLYTDHVRASAYFMGELSKFAMAIGDRRLYWLTRRAEPGMPLSPASSLAKNFRDLLDDGVYSDVTLKAGSTVMRAHKAILMARCEYFRTWFDGNAAYADRGLPVLDLSHALLRNGESIDDMEAAFRTLIEFVYTGDRDLVRPECALDVLICADYFLAVDLKRLCEAALVTAVDGENVHDLLAYAQRHDAPRLAERCRAVAGGAARAQTVRS